MESKIFVHCKHFSCINYTNQNSLQHPWIDNNIEIIKQKEPIVSPVGYSYIANPSRAWEHDTSLSQTFMKPKFKVFVLKMDPVTSSQNLSTNIISSSFMVDLLWALIQDVASF